MCLHHRRRCSDGAFTRRKPATTAQPYMTNFPWIPATLVCMAWLFSCDSTAFQCLCSWPKYAPCPCPPSVNLDFLAADTAVTPLLSSQQGFSGALLDLLRKYLSQNSIPLQDRTKFCFLEHRKPPPCCYIHILILGPKASVGSTHGQVGKLPS